MLLLVAAGCDRSATPAPAAATSASHPVTPAASPVAPRPAVAKPLGRLVFASQRDGRVQLYLVRADGSGLERLLSSDASDYPAAASGGRLLFVRAQEDPHREQLFSLDLAGRSARALSPPSGKVRNPAPAGASVVFESDARSFRALYRAPASGAVERLTDDKEGSFEPHARGETLVFVSSRGGDAEIYRRDLGTSHDQRLTWSKGDDTGPRLSPDGRRVAFISSRAGKPRLHLMGADGSKPHGVDDDPDALEDAHPRWSPDGARVVFVRRHQGRSSILVWREGGRVEALTSGPWRDDTPAWSPDGAYVAFSSERDGNTDIYLRPLRHDRTVRLTNHAADDWLPRWID